MFVADFTYAQLGPSDRVKVESKISQLLNRAGVLPAVHRRWAPWMLRMAFRAEAMSRLGIPPAAKGVEWPKFVGAAGATRVGIWFLDYRESDEATTAAREALKKVGAYLARDPLEERYVEPDLIPRPQITVREYYLRKRAQVPTNSSTESPHGK
jgi:hypothetical protein